MGSSPGCDWQVAAPGVPSIELLFTGEELFVWIEQVRDEIRCNDAPLPLGFTQLRHEDRLDLGPARIVVSLGMSLARLARPQPPTREAESQTDESNKTRAKVQPHAAELRIRRGASRLPAWTFSPADIGKSVTVGAADECDVQIVAAGVEARELTVLYAGDTLLVKSARPENGPKLNGQHLAEEWQFLRDGDRLDMGTACIDVHFSIADLTSSGEREIAEARVRAREPSVEVRVQECEPVVEAREAREPPIEARKASVEACVQAREPAVEERPVPQAVLCSHAGSTLLEAPRLRAARKSVSVRKPDAVEARRGTRPKGEWGLHTGMLQQSEPELVESLFAAAPAPPRASKKRLGYAVALVAIVWAYTAWLGLLDYWWPDW